MGRYHEHVTVEECEEIMVARRKGKSIRRTAREIGRCPSTVKRELDRSVRGGRRYRASAIQRRSNARSCRSGPGRWPPRARRRLGADTAVWRAAGACPVTLVDRRDGLLTGGLAALHTKAEVACVEGAALSRQPALSVTPDRGKEFADWATITREMGAESCFCAARTPGEGHHGEHQWPDQGVLP